MFPTLKELGAHDIYDRAAHIIEEHGFSNYTTYDPYTKEVDIWGSILLACGGKEKLLAQGETGASGGVGAGSSLTLVFALMSAPISTKGSISADRP
jgi:hypothetical protein